MRCLRLAVAFLAAAVAVATLGAQPGGWGPAPDRPPMPLAVALLDGIDDPAVVADLKLTDAQVKALVARRTALWDESYTTAPNELRAGEAARAKSTDELLRKTLSADQYKRAGQLVAQDLFVLRGWGEPDAEPTFRFTTVSSTVLKRYPELVTVFKLTDEQKKQLDAPLASTEGGKSSGFRTIRMSQAQADAAKAFLGPVAKPWQAKHDPRTQGRSSEALMTFWLLEAKDVRADLKFGDTETKPVNDLADKWQKLSADRQTVLSPKGADARSAELAAESEKVVAALTPEQAKRLKQIQFQTGRGFSMSGPGGGPGGRFGSSAWDMHIESMYAQESVSKPLELTGGQREQFRAVRLAFNADAAKVLAEAQAADAAAKKLDELVAARKKKAEAVLTAVQAQKWADLVGAPFTGSTISDRNQRAFRPSFPVEEMRAATFGKHTPIELNLLAANKAVQEELKMDDKQIKKAIAARDQQGFGLSGPPGTPEYAKSVEERSKRVADALKTLLTEDQAKRFRQLALQYWEGRTVPPRPGAITTVIPSAIVYPGVAEAVKLTEDQKKKLLAGTAPAEVLSAAQKTAIKEMLGEPFRGDLAPTFGSGRGSFPTVPATVRVFQYIGAAEDDLKLTDEQMRKLTAAQQAFRQAQQDAQPNGGFGGPSFNEYAAALKAAYEGYDSVIGEILTDAQKARVAQLAHQVNAAQNLFSALTAPDVAKKLALTDAEIEKLRALSTDANKLHDLRSTHLPISFNAEDGLGPRMRDAADERMMAVLTDAQKKAWKELTGEPLKGLRKTVPNSRFGGGPGGPGWVGGPGAFGP